MSITAMMRVPWAYRHKCVQNILDWWAQWYVSLAADTYSMPGGYNNNLL